MAITFEDYILGLTSGTITTGSDYIPYYDAGVSEVRKGSIIQPTAGISLEDIFYELKSGKLSSYPIK